MRNKAATTIVIFIILFIGVWFLADARKNSNSFLNSPTPSPSLQLNIFGQTLAPPETSISPSASPTSSESGSLEITDVSTGDGEEAKTGDTVEVNYTGTLVNGDKFDSSFDRNQTFSFTLGSGQVIKGWDMGVLGMKVGGERKLIVPPSLGYDSQSTGKIPPNSTLYFDIFLISVKH